MKTVKTESKNLKNYNKKIKIISPIIIKSNSIKHFLKDAFSG